MNDYEKKQYKKEYYRNYYKNNLDYFRERNKSDTKKQYIIETIIKKIKN